MSAEHLAVGATVSVLEHPEGRCGVNDVSTIPEEEAQLAATLQDDPSLSTWL